MKNNSNYKQIFYSFLLFALLAVLVFPFQASAQTPPADKMASKRVEVLDFHTEHRCKTCLTIEKFTKEVLKDQFATEMEKGIISFQLVNADKKENYSLAEKYGAFGTSLIINVVNEGEENFTDITNFAFLKANEEDEFKSGLRDHIAEALQKISL